MEQPLSLETRIPLNDSNTIRLVGVGFSGAVDKDETYKATRLAIDAGVRMIDVAWLYGFGDNEEAVGRAVRDAVDTGDVIREEMDIFSKMHPLQFLDPAKAVNDSNKRLGLDYIDHYLLHWPLPLPTKLDDKIWRAMESFADEGIVRSIGVSNFLPRQLQRQVALAEHIPPSLNQVRSSSLHYDEHLHNVCAREGVQVMGYNLLAGGKIIEHPTLKAIAQEIGATTAPVAGRWSLQKNGGTPFVVRATTEEHINQLVGIFDIELTDEHMQSIDAMNQVRPGKMERAGELATSLVSGAASFVTR